MRLGVQVYPSQATEFEWDDDTNDRGNTAHIGEHAITQVDVEDIFWNGPVWAPTKPPRSDRWRMLVIHAAAGR